MSDGLDVAAVYGVIGLEWQAEIGAAARRVARFDAATGMIRRRLGPRTDSRAFDATTRNLRKLPAGPIVLFVETLAQADVAELDAVYARLRGCGHPLWSASPAVLAGAVLARVRALQSGVLVPAAVAAEVRALLRTGLDAATRRDGGLTPSAALSVLLADLDTAARGTSRPMFVSEPATEPPPTIELVDAAEVARRTGWTVQHVTRLCRAGRLDARWIGRQWLIKTDLEAAVNDDRDSDKGNRSF